MRDEFCIILKLTLRSRFVLVAKPIRTSSYQLVSYLYMMLSVYDQGSSYLPVIITATIYRSGAPLLH